MRSQNAKKPGRGRLAIVVPHSGQPTETFIRRYAEKLAPGQVVMAHFYHGADAWKLNAPTYFPEQAFGGSRLLAKAWRGCQKLAGIDSLFGDPYMASSLERFLRHHGVKAVFSQYLVAGAAIQRVVSRMGLRHVVRGHGYDLSASLENPRTRLCYQALEKASSIVVPTPYQKERLRNIGLRKVAIHAQPCGIDLPAAVIRRPAGQKGIEVVTAGRMVPKKAPLLALGAFFKAAECCPNLTLTMIGDGPMMGEVRERCAQHPLGKKVTLTGALSHHDALERIDKAAIFLQHSITDPQTGDQEGAPVAILEAMARGLPVISTRHSGIPHLVRDGVTGLLSAEGDTTAMAKNLIRLAEQSLVRERMGRAGRKRVGNFTWKRERDLLLRLISPKE